MGQLKGVKVRRVGLFDPAKDKIALFERVLAETVHEKTLKLGERSLENKAREEVTLAEFAKFIADQSIAKLLTPEQGVKMLGLIKKAAGLEEKPSLGSHNLVYQVGNAIFIQEGFKYKTNEKGVRVRTYTAVEDPSAAYQPYVDLFEKNGIPVTETHKIFEKPLPPVSERFKKNAFRLAARFPSGSRMQDRVDSRTTTLSGLHNE